MAEKAGKASRIEKFYGIDFAYGRKLHLPLLGTKLESMKAEKCALLDRQVLGVIRLTLSRFVAHNVVKEKITTDLMKALSSMYEKSSANNKVHLMKKLFNLKMAKNASVTQHLNEFNTITNQLSSVKIDFDDEIYALIVLASLSNSWETMRMAVSNSTRKEKLKYNDIRYLILDEEIRRRDTGETSGSGSTLNLEIRGRDNDKNSNQDRSKSRNSNRNISKSRSGQQVQCWICGKTVDGPLDDWVLDSRASFHTTPHREIIQNYTVSDFGKMYLVDSSVLNVVGLGDVRILLPNGSAWLLEKATKGVRVLARGKKAGTLYMTSCPRDTIAIVDASIDTSLWHHKLGHMSEKGMKMLLSKGKLPELKSIDFDILHTDLWGPSSIASLGGSRSNNGGEYIDGGFSEHCVAHGIRMEKTIPGTPQQNGVAERMNRTLNERARSMRLHVRLPKTFWADAISTAAYLINREPSVPMEFRLPEEVWNDKESKICFFIGYGDEKFGYRFWDEQNKKIIRNRNVIFNEQVMYKDRSTVVSDVTEIDQKKSKFVNLDELTKSTVQKGGEEDKENVNSQVDLSTPVAEVCRSSRNIRPPQRYSPVLNYLLLTNGGESECYDEALQDENSSKWELTMKDEMDSCRPSILSY
ncbi:Retrovirus-related Pol polyprotein from transposon TNT 1-94 [Vitis vinifera]|uniref:Retrovirus-related Pol polyprotein from transposon TNT 1-94 n=1 Tax=Vitis vinifera TaxID=29760 RepID=A0A438H8N7_VITVI|nr:Retrovirus-related Pol polyprotein from transposon TNT 1-94 [Vitis vinifera]